MQIVTGNETLTTIKINKYCLPLTLVGIVSTFYVAMNTPTLPGTELFWTIPGIFTICAFLFCDIIPYHKNGFAFKIFYLLIFLKYLVLPIDTCIVGKFSGEWGYFSTGAYTYAILMQDIELFVCCCVIKYYYGREYKKNERYVEKKIVYYNDFSLGSILVMGCAVLLITSRGINRLLSSVRFGLITSALDEEGRYGYDIWLGQTMLAFLVIVIVETFSKRKDSGKKLGYTIVPLIAVALSCLIVFGNNRTMLIYYATCGLMILIKAFPEKKKMFYSIIIPTVLIVIVSFTLLKQFHIDVTGTSSTLKASSNDSVGVQQYLTAYLCGTESIAKCYHRYAETGGQMTAITWLVDIINKTSILGLPVLNSVIKAVSSIPTSYSLAMYGVEIIPVTGQTIFLGGYILGPIFDIISFIVIMRLLIKCDVKAKTSRNLSRVYVFTWLAGIFSFCMCRSLSVMYANSSYIPFYLVITLGINKYIRAHSRQKSMENEK